MLFHRRPIPRRSALMMLAGAAGVSSQARAGTLPQPTDKPILTVAGKISNTNGDDVARFDRALLESIGQASFETKTPWYDRPMRFEGVPMDTLMQAVGGSGTKTVATALNDYECEIPVSDFARYGVLLALKRDGQYMSIREKGPLFIIYPFDTYPELRSTTYTSRCAWQVRRLTIT
jgi:hypothetical protein